MHHDFIYFLSRKNLVLYSTDYYLLLIIKSVSLLFVHNTHNQKLISLCIMILFRVIIINNILLSIACISYNGSRRRTIVK